MLRNTVTMLASTKETEQNNMKKITVFKQSKVEAPAEFKEVGVVAFQVVNFVIDYFENKIECSHDTKIMEDGRQIVIGGDGFIPEGFEVCA